MPPTLDGPTARTSGYAPVHGLRMYYEIDGTGDPLVYIPNAFGFAGLTRFPALAQCRSVISVDLQGHGRTADLPERPLSIEQHADDVVALLTHLGIAKADFFGASYGGAAAMMIAVRYPELVRRVVAVGATFGPPQSAHNVGMLRFDRPLTAHAQGFRFQRESYATVAPDPGDWPKIWEKVAGIRWDGFSAEQLASVGAMVLI
ncbi:MAG: alpha/beta fold hydrolase, partial [Gemmatimonadaceae bacterium]|nr:alpha/beta fold hydrolase [Gemmatimonadaceae bacterium]